MQSAGPWPQVIMRSFFIAGAIEKPFYRSWNRLLNTVFPVDTIFEVVPQFPPTTSREAVDFLLLLLIYVETTPVFVVEIKPPADLRLSSKRQEADEQLRRRLVDIVDGLKIPVLHGVSAFGTKMAFYKLTRDTRRLEPRGIITPDSEIATSSTMVGPRHIYWRRGGRQEVPGRSRGGEGDVQSNLLVALR